MDDDSGLIFERRIVTTSANELLKVKNQINKLLLGDYYVDNTSSDRNAFWLWSNNVRNEQII